MNKKESVTLKQLVLDIQIYVGLLEYKLIATMHETKSSIILY